MTRIARAFAAALLAVLLSLAGSAHAERGLVVILGPSSDHPTVAQMRNELLLLGFDVSVLWAAAPMAKLDAVGRRYGAAAVARVVDWPPEVIVWVNPDHEGRSDGEAPEIYVSDSLAEPAEHRLLALGAVELLRGRLLPVPDVATPPGPSPSQGGGVPQPAGPPQANARGPDAAADKTTGATAPPKPEGPVEPAAHERPATFRLRPAVLLGPSGTPATPHVFLGAGLRLAGRLSFDADVLIPTTAGSVSATEGTVDLRTLLLVGGLGLRLTPAPSAWFARAGLGAGAAGLFFGGDAALPYEGRDGSAWAFAPYASTVLGYNLHPMVAVRADALLTVLVPEPVVRIAGSEAASLGRPAIVLGAGVEIRP